MLEIPASVGGALLVLVGIAWRFRFHRTGIPAVRAQLAHPDPTVRAAAVDGLARPAGSFAPELIDLARRELAPEVHDALARLVDRTNHESPDATEWAELAELRTKVASWMAVDAAVLTTIPGWSQDRAAELRARLEAVLGEEVVSLRVLTRTENITVKTSKETP